MREKRLRAVILVSWFLAILMMPAAVLADSETGAVHEIYPSGDTTGQTDGDVIQAAVDTAFPGDTILLKAGTFYLGKYLETDESWVSTSRGTFQFLTELVPHTLRSELNPYWDIYGGYEGPSPPFPQWIVIDKPLVILGENLADSDDPADRTVITVAHSWLDEGWSLNADMNGFVVCSSEVIIKNLEIYNMVYGIWILSAGTTTKDCIFRDCGHYAFNFVMDDYSVYPEYPEYIHPVKSYVIGNKWLNVPDGMHMYSSEVLVADNYFKLRKPFPLPVDDFTFPAITFGGLWDIPSLHDIFSQSLCRNNLVMNNVVEGDIDSGLPAFYFSGWGPPVLDNTIAQNTVRNMLAMVGSWGSVQVERNIIAFNVAEGCGNNPWYPGYGIAMAGFSHIPKDNVISFNQFIDTHNPMFIDAGEGNWLMLNDYRDSGCPGWDYGLGCVYLGYMTSNNFVLERLFPATTTISDQVLDLGEENRVVRMP
ncbi:MAG: hypothetical protein ACFFER_13795 [Candidatus Thorarchaeota archaeon]